MKTPMQELIEQLQNKYEQLQQSGDLVAAMYVQDAIELAHPMLEKEKEFALNLWGQYEKECIIYNDYLGDHAYSIDAIEWYDQTFNTKEK